VPRRAHRTQSFSTPPKGLYSQQMRGAPPTGQCSTHERPPWDICPRSGSGCPVEAEHQNAP
jgi:hypothetical protein